MVRNSQNKKLTKRSVFCFGEGKLNVDSKGRPYAVGAEKHPGGMFLAHIYIDKSRPLYYNCCSCLTYQGDHNAISKHRTIQRK